MAADVQIEQHIRLLRLFAHQVCARLAATGSHTTQFEDVLQECAVAWCMARDAWSPEHNVPFVAFLKRGMINHVNRWVGKEIMAYNASTFELDASFSDEARGSGHDLIADKRTVSPEENALSHDRREKALAKLSPRARQFIELLESPPQCIVDAVRALQDRRKFAVERGYTGAMAPKRVQSAMIFQFMDCSRIEITKIKKELEKKFNLKSVYAEMDRVNA